MPQLYCEQAHLGQFQEMIRLWKKKLDFQVVKIVCRRESLSEIANYNIF